MEKTILQELIAKKYTQREIAKYFNKPHSTIHNWLKKYGLSTNYQIKPKIKLIEKKCASCKQIKKIENFNNNKKSKCGYGCWCKQRIKKYDAERFKRRIPEEKERSRLKRTRYREQNTKYLLNYFLAHPCVDCGETDPIVLEFDHINPLEKKYNISEMVGGCSIELIKKEIDKCKVRCANCHRRKTARDRNFLMLQLIKKGNYRA